MERREMERERMLQQQQQRLSESTKSVQRDRSPLRNGNDIDTTQIKIEPKRDDEMLMRQSSMMTDPRYHHPSASAAAAAAHHSYMTSRHGPHIIPPPPPHLSRSMLGHSMSGPPMSHYPPPGPGWGLDPYGRDPYRMDPMHQLRYNPLMEAAIRVEEERSKAMSLYAAHSVAHLRSKEPSPVPPPHHRMPPGSIKPTATMSVGPGHPVSVDMHKKEDSTSAR